MAQGVRESMVRSAVLLIATRGVQGTSFADVLEHSGAPRGSVYHHFPGGKDELVTAAMEYMATQGLAGLERRLAANPPTARGVVDGFVGLWHDLLERTDFTVGCSVAGVTVTAESDALRTQASGVFDAWAARLADLLVAAGLPRRRATDLAWTMIAATEGAVVLARAEHSFAPLDAVARQLRRLAAD